MKRSKQDLVQLSGIEQIYKRFDLSKGMSINRAIINVSRFIDDQSNPGKASNAIIHTLDVPVPFISQPSRAKVVALTLIQQTLVQETFNPELAAKIAMTKCEKMVKRMPYGFKDEIVEDTADSKPTIKKRKAPKRGNKREVASKIYFDNKNMPEKEVIALIAKEMNVTPQNAYTYVYLIKKSLKLKGKR